MIKLKLGDKDEGCFSMFKQYTLAAVLVYYIDYWFDIIDGPFLIWPQDILHYLLWFATLPIRLLGKCCDWLYYVYWRETCIPKGDTKFSWMRYFGVTLQKRKDYRMNERQSIFERKKKCCMWSRDHFCMINFQVERWDSLNTYADIAMITGLVYL